MPNPLYKNGSNQNEINTEYQMDFEWPQKKKKHKLWFIR